MEASMWMYVVVFSAGYDPISIDQCQKWCSISKTIQLIGCRSAFAKMHVLWAPHSTLCRQHDTLYVFHSEEALNPVFVEVLLPTFTQIHRKGYELYYTHAKHTHNILSRIHGGFKWPYSPILPFLFGLFHLLLQVYTNFGVRSSWDTVISILHSDSSFQYILGISSAIPMAPYLRKHCGWTGWG